MNKKKYIIIITGITLGFLAYSTLVVVLTLIIHSNNLINIKKEDIKITTTPTAENKNINDTFDNNNNDWNVTQEDSEYGKLSKTIENGEYIWNIESKKSLQTSVTANVEPAKNFTLSVDVKKSSGPKNSDSGLVFNKLDSDNYYKFNISDGVGKYNLILRYLNTSKNLIGWTTSDSIKANETNNLKVVVRETEITLFINNIEVNKITDDTFSMNNKAGLSVSVYTTNSTQENIFDNFIYQIDPD